MSEDLSYMSQEKTETSNDNSLRDEIRKAAEDWVYNSEHYRDMVEGDDEAFIRAVTDFTEGQVREKDAEIERLKADIRTGMAAEIWTENADLRRQLELAQAALRQFCTCHGVEPGLAIVMDDCKVHGKAREKQGSEG